MNIEKTGELIKSLRTKMGMTQLQIAEKLNISDKTISKWERGLGCPDVSLLNDLSKFFGVNIEQILNGELNENENNGGNMKNLNFYVCSECGNIITSQTCSEVSCCGRKLNALVADKINEEHQIKTEKVENELLLEIPHEATKEHYISFVALQNSDTLFFKKLYPEWDISLRLPNMHGKLSFYCTNHGLFYKNI